MENREIKFRAWHIGKKIMAKVGTLHHDGDIRVSWIDAVRYEQEKHSGLFYPGAVSADWANGSHILMQYTCLKDRNGVEIFEGDILKVVTFGFDQEVFTASVIWAGVGFSLSNNRSLLYFGQKGNICDDAKIIGNIYQHPELCSD